MIYNWQQQDWPNFQFRLETSEDRLFRFAELTGHVSGILKSLPPDVEMEAIINTMVMEATKTSQIEGEHLNRQDVISSIRNKLGLNTALENVRNKKAQGAGELMIEVRKTYAELMTEEMVLAWHRMLMNASRDLKAQNKVYTGSTSINKKALALRLGFRSPCPT